MAQKRMFSKTITNSSRFLMMSPTAQVLYIHLGMNADDDGFVEHFPIMRMVEAKPDDLKILAAKEFVKIFDDQVLVITDWKENNNIRNDRYTPSKYLAMYKKELAEISLNSPEKELGIPSGNQVATKVIPSIDKVSIDKIRLDKNNKDTKVSVAVATKLKKGKRIDIDQLLEGIKGIVKVLDGSILEQRRFAKNFLDSKTPEILRQSGNLNPTAEQIQNATLRIFQLARQDNFHSKNCTSLKYVYNKAGAIVMSVKSGQPKVAIIPNN